MWWCPAHVASLLSRIHTARLTGVCARDRQRKLVKAGRTMRFCPDKVKLEQAAVGLEAGIVQLSMLPTAGDVADQLPHDLRVRGWQCGSWLSICAPDACCSGCHRNVQGMSTRIDVAQALQGATNNATLIGLAVGAAYPLVIMAATLADVLAKHPGHTLDVVDITTGGYAVGWQAGMSLRSPLTVCCCTLPVRWCRGAGRSTRWSDSWR